MGLCCFSKAHSGNHTITITALAIASSGIASVLLHCVSTTIQSALKLTCDITKNSGKGKGLQTCHIIIWDKCTMSHKKALIERELDRTLRDLGGNTRIFSGPLIFIPFISFVSELNQYSANYNIDISSIFQFDRTINTDVIK